jgi:hypothetical protein
MKFTNTFHSKALQNIPNVGFLVCKCYHLATLSESDYFNVPFITFYMYV